MTTLPASIALGFAQLFDGAVLRILVKSILVTLVVFAVVATGGWFLLDWLLGNAGLEDTLFAGAGAFRGALSLILTLVGLWLVWRIVAMGVIQFFAEDVVKAVERRHYPQDASAARDIPFAQSLKYALTAAGRALLANLAALPFAAFLLFTGVGTFAVFWLVNAVLVGRELQDMVWLRHRQDAAHQPPVRGSERFLLGGLVAAMLAVPFVNFLAPVLGAASATHLIHRQQRKA